MLSLHRKTREYILLYEQIIKNQEVRERTVPLSVLKNHSSRIIISALQNHMWIMVGGEPVTFHNEGRISRL